MGQGLTDLYTSRRTHFIRCKFWSQEEHEEIANKNELLYKVEPTGTFMATEENSYANRNNILADSFLFDANFIVIRTNDDVSKLRTNDKVWTDDGNFWIVEDVQRKPFKKNRGMLKSKYCAASYYISLRR